jgi:hypothetical protein
MDWRNFDGYFVRFYVCLGVLMNTPYDTGKVKIGLYYQPPRYVESDPDMIAIQGWFLGCNKAAIRNYWANVAYCWLLAVAVVLAVIFS